MRVRSVLSVLVILAMLAGCSAPENAGVYASADSPKGESRELVDMLGRTVTLDTDINRIVVLTASDCEIVFALGAGDMVAGRGEYCDYPGETSNIPTVQSGNETNIEQILALEPQVVIIGKMAQSVEEADALSAAGIPAFITDAHNIEDVYESILALGGLLGRENEAESLCRELRDGLSKIRDKLPENREEKTVYFEVSPLEYDLWTAGADTFMDEIAQLLGLTNAFSDIEGWGKISQEQVIARAPDYIVSVTMFYGEGLDPREEIYSREGWQSIPALKNGNIFLADSDSITRPGPRLVTAAQHLFQQVYGG